MADIVTRRELEDAKIDAKDLGEAVNEKVIVSPRYGGDFKSLPLLSDEAQSSINGWDEAIRLITYESGVPALAVSDASGKTQQNVNDLLLNTPSAIKLSLAGAVPDDPSKAVANELILINAIRSGSVIVDGRYYIACSASHSIDNSFKLIKENAGELVFTNMVAGWLNVSSIDYINISVDLKCSTTTLTHSLITTQTDTTRIGKFSLNNSNVDFGIGRIFSKRFSVTANPSIQDYGIKELVVNSNIFSNAIVLFNCINMPFDKLGIKNNTYKNMGGCAYYLGNENSHSFPAPLQSNQKLAEFYNETLRNDDDFFSTADLGYYALAVIECYECRYDNITVEGIKTRLNVVVYDIYANCEILHASRVFWKNNLCMNASKYYGDLMKSKGSVSSSYNDCDYILEKEFVQRHDADKAGMAWVMAFVKSSISAKSQFDMRNVRINVYELLGHSSANLTKSVDIRGNTIKAEKFAGSFLNFQSANTDAVTYSDASVVIKDNEFDFKQIGTIVRDGTAYTSARLVTRSGGTPIDNYKEIDVSKNVVKINDVTNLFSPFFGLVAKNVRTSENEFIINNLSANFTFDSASSGDNVKSIDNKVSVSGAGILPTSLLTQSINPTKLYSYSTELEGVYNARLVFVEKPTTGNKVVLFSNEAFYSAGKFSAAFALKVSSSGVTYTNGSGVEVTEPFPATDYTTITPKVFAVSGNDTVMTGVTVLVRSDGRVQLRTNFTGPSNNVTYMTQKVSIEII